MTAMESWRDMRRSRFQYHRVTDKSDRSALEIPTMGQTGMPFHNHFRRDCIS